MNKIKLGKKYVTQFRFFKYFRQNDSLFLEFNIFTVFPLQNHFILFIQFG